MSNILRAMSDGIYIIVNHSYHMTAAAYLSASIPQTRIIHAKIVCVAHDNVTDIYLIQTYLNIYNDICILDWISPSTLREGWPLAVHGCVCPRSDIWNFAHIKPHYHIY